MRAVVYRGVNDLRLETVPVPRIGPGELLVQVAACGVCPTDIKKIQYGTVPPPRIFGHETAGTIVEAGVRRLARRGSKSATASPCTITCRAWTAIFAGITPSPNARLTNAPASPPDSSRRAAATPNTSASCPSSCPAS